MALFFAKNNHIFVSNYINNETGEKPIERIYNKYMTDPGDSVPDSSDSFSGEYFSDRNNEIFSAVFRKRIRDAFNVFRTKYPCRRSE